MPSFFEVLLQRPRLALKLLVGVAIIISLLVFLGMRRSRMRDQVRRSLAELAVLPPITHDEFVRDQDRFGSAEASMLAIYKLGEESVPMLFEEMEESPKTRAWGLLALLQFPIQISSGRYAPPLKQLVAWIDDPDPAVAVNASEYLRNVFRVPEERAAEGPALRIERIPSKATPEERRGAAERNRRAYGEWVKAWCAKKEFTWKAAAGGYVPEE